jgi:hypothetical protein
MAFNKDKQESSSTTNLPFDKPSQGYTDVMFDLLKRRSETLMDEDIDVTTDLPLEPTFDEEESYDSDPEVQVEDVQAGPAVRTIACDSEYYAQFIRSCLDSGGRFGETQIPTRWLRMTLCGLEGKDPGPAEMWGDEEEQVEEQATPNQEAIYAAVYQVPAQATEIPRV